MLSNNIHKLEKVINSELTSKILKSYIEFDELLIEINTSDLIDVLQFLKSNDDCKFKQRLYTFRHICKRLHCIFLRLYSFFF